MRIADKIIHLGSDAVLEYLAARVASGDADAARAFVDAWRARQRARIDRFLSSRGRRIGIGLGVGLGLVATAVIVRRRRRALADRGTR